MYTRRGYTHHNCLLLCMQITASHVNNDAMSLDALHILYYLLHVYLLNFDKSS